MRSLAALPPPLTVVRRAATTRTFVDGDGLDVLAHWIKAIATDPDAAGGAAPERDLAIGSYKPINSLRFVNDCHEYVSHYSHNGATPLDRTAIGAPTRRRSGPAA